MLKFFVVGKNLINGEPQVFDLREGAVFVDNYNETLDSGTVIIPHLTEEIEIEPYDLVCVYSTFENNVQMNTRYMLVDSYVCTQTCLEPAIYKYEISLFSATKLLEGILLPSLSITHLKEGNQRSIKYYLEQYLNEYYPDIVLTSRTSSKFENEECPELQWNEPTLREVLNDLMIVKDCIPVLKYNSISKIYELDYIDISSNLGEINSLQRKGINYITKSQSSQDYVSELKTKLQNTVGENSTRICENITWRNYDTYILTTENLKVETSMPIYNLISTTMYLKITARMYLSLKTNPDVNFQLDFVDKQTITLFGGDNDLILEYGEWLTKKINYAGWNNLHAPTTEFQNTCLYYKRGEKGIQNWSNKQEGKVLWIGYSKSVLDLFIEYLFNDDKIKEDFDKQTGHGYYEYNVSVMSKSYDWKKCYFNVEYDTLGEHTLLASKIDENSLNKRQVIDNQTQSYVNARNFGILEYAKANRLGNKIKLVNGRYNVSEGNIPRLAQTINGSIIFRKENAVYNDFIKTNFQATDNYVLRDYFTGVKSKLRSWRILQGDEAFVRADNLKFYFNSNLQSVATGDYTIPVYETLQDYLDKFNYCVVRFKTQVNGENVYLPNGILYKNEDYQTDGYMLEFQKVICGNSVLFTIKALDNAIVGKYVSDDNYDVGNGVKAMTQQICKYVDDNGENLGGEIYFYENYSINEMTEEKKEALCNLYPCVAMSGLNSGLSHLVARIPFNFHKDNKEITQITVQFEYNEYANDIFVGKR